MISNNIFTSDIVSGQHFYSDKLIARTPQGLHIVDDEDNGMFLEDGGNIGIGTTDPSHNLHIAGGTPSMKLEGSQPRIWLRETDQTDLNTLIRNNNSVFEIDTVSDADAYVQNRFAINHGNGNVRINDLLGIGKDPDGYHLDVAAPGAGANGIRVQTNNASSNAIVHIGGGGSSDIKFKVDGSGSVTTAKDVTIGGNLTVNGTTTTVNSTTVTVDDKNIELGSVDTPTNTTADGGGITLKGATDKEFKWTNASNSWNSSEHLGIADGKHLFTDKVRARDNAGLLLQDSNGNGIFIEDGGNVGIGTTNPFVDLDVNGGTNTQLRLTASDSLGMSAVNFGDQDNAAAGRIIYSHVDDSLSFKTNNVNNRFTIDSNGNVGIGTPSPARLLSVEDSSSNAFVSIVSKNDSRSAIFFGDTDSDGQGRIDYDNSDDHLHFSTSATERMRIDSSGNVGIGTTSPSEKLDISGTVKATRAKLADLDIRSFTEATAGVIGDLLPATNTSKFGTIIETDPNGQMIFGIRGNDENDAFRILTKNYAASTTNEASRPYNYAALCVESSGNVGIGTTSPEEVLHIKSTTPIIKLTDTNTNLSSLLHADTGMGSLIFVADSTAGGTNPFISFRTQGTSTAEEKLRITDNGNVGIGTTTPDHQLHVAGDGYFAGDSVPNIAPAAGVYLGKSENSPSHHVSIVSADSENAYIDFSNTTRDAIGRILYANPSSSWPAGQGLSFYADYTGQNNVPDFFIKSDGNVGIGTTTPAGTLELSSTATDVNLYMGGTPVSGGREPWRFQSEGDYLHIGQNKSSFAQYMTFHGSSVGIGTTTPSQKLHVYGTTLLESSNAKLCVCANGKIEIQATVEVDDDGGSKGLWFGDIGESQSKGYIGGGAYAVNGLGANDFGISSSTGNNLAFGIGGVGKMTILNNGNVGIGTATPESALHVVGKATIESSGPVLVLKDTDGGDVNSQNGFIDYRDQNDAQRGYVGFGSSTNKEFSIWNMIGDIRLGTGTTVNMRIKENGTVEIPGDLVVTGKTTTNNVETVSTSNGVVFEGSATDDHEGTLKAGTLTADRAYTLPNQSGTVAMTSDIKNSAITITAGGALTGGGTLNLNQSSAETITINHQDTSSQGSSNNSGRTYIQDISLDGYGHVTSIGTASETVVASNAAITITAGNALTGGGTLNLNQSSAETITINHQDTSSQGSSNNSGRTYIQDITLDTYGHVTAIGTATETVINTDTNTTYSNGNHLTLTGTEFSVNRDLRGGTDPSTGVYAIGQNDQSYFIIHGIFSKKAETYLGGNLISKLEEDGDFHVEGDVVAFSTTVSDEKFKDNIGQIKSGLEKVKKLRGVEFDWNATSRKGTKDIGVIAQEVEQVIPEVVSEKVPCVGEFCENTEKYKTVDYAKLVPVLIEAIKDLSEEVEELKKKLS
tara:strand:+ start:40036 stop:44283 length:4248 start_codon:yes stop_codon:yes gene_type:complete